MKTSHAKPYNHHATMKRVKALRPALLLFSLFLVRTPAQQPQQLQQSSSPTAPTPAVKVKYDGFRDVTRFSIERELVFGTIFHGIFLRATYSCPGQQTNCAPFAVDFSLVVASGDVKYDEPGVLKIRREGAGKASLPLVLNMQHIGTERFDGQIPAHGEIYTAAIKTEDFIRMSESTALNLQLDDVKFKLTPHNMQSLQALAKQIKR